MSTAKKKTAPGDAFVKITRDMLESDTWPLLNINARRLLDFLEREHLRHGGQENGKLLAPWDQLVEFGIGRRFIGDAIMDAKVLGFIDVKEGTGRAPNTYTLTFLTMPGGAEPTNRWRTVVVHKGAPQEPSVVVHQGELVRFTKVHYKARSGSPRCTTTPSVVVHQGEHLSRRRSFRGRGISTGVYGAEGADAAEPAAAPARPKGG